MKFDNISQELLIARGMYATCRSEHEKEKANMQMLCGAVSSYSSQILRAVQPADNAAPDMVNVAELLKGCRNCIIGIEDSAAKIKALAEQRAALKPMAWPRT